MPGPKSEKDGLKRFSRSTSEASKVDTWIKEMEERGFQCIEAYEAQIQAWLRTTTFLGIYKAVSIATKLLEDPSSSGVRLLSFHPIFSVWLHSKHGASTKAMKSLIDRLTEASQTHPHLAPDGRMMGALIAAHVCRQIKWLEDAKAADFSQGTELDEEDMNETMDAESDELLQEIKYEEDNNELLGAESDEEKGSESLSEESEGLQQEAEEPDEEDKHESLVSRFVESAAVCSELLEDHCRRFENSMSPDGAQDVFVDTPLKQIEILRDSNNVTFQLKPCSCHILLSFGKIIFRMIYS